MPLRFIISSVAVTILKAAPSTKPIVLIGFMGSGKTRIGRQLARRLKLEFLDTDRVIEEAFRLSVAEIFERHGEQAFRACEREMIARHLIDQPRILSLGGGAFVDPETRALARANAITIWLDPPFELILERLARSSRRPLAAGKNPAELRRLWNERRAHYAEAQIRIITDDDAERSVRQIVDSLD